MFLEFSNLSTSSNNTIAHKSESCKSILQNLENAAEQMLKSGLINPIEDTSSRNLLSIDDITKSVSNGCVPQV